VGVFAVGSFLAAVYGCNSGLSPSLKRRKI
jgi:hypothetical protein